jgi:hypothetical protein
VLTSTSGSESLTTLIPIHQLSKTEKATYQDQGLLITISPKLKISEIKSCVEEFNRHHEAPIYPYRLILENTTKDILVYSKVLLNTGTILPIKKTRYQTVSLSIPSIPEPILLQQYEKRNPDARVEINKTQHRLYQIGIVLRKEISQIINVEPSLKAFLLEIQEQELPKSRIKEIIYYFISVLVDNCLVFQQGEFDLEDYYKSACCLFYKTKKECDVASSVCQWQEGIELDVDNPVSLETLFDTIINSVSTESKDIIHQQYVEPILKKYKVRGYGKLVISLPESEKDRSDVLEPIYLEISEELTHLPILAQRILHNNIQLPQRQRNYQNIIVEQQPPEEFVYLIRNLKQIKYINQDIFYQLASQHESRTLQYQPVDNSFVSYPHHTPTVYHVLVSEPEEHTLVLTSKAQVSSQTISANGISLSNRPPQQVILRRST